MFDQGPTPDQIMQGASLQMQIALAQEQMKDAEEEYGEVAPYIRQKAAERMTREAQAGRAPINTPRDGVRAYRAALQVEAEEFKKTFRPGYQRDPYNPQLPSDVEVKDYVAERRREQQSLKEHGQRVGRIGPNSPPVSRIYSEYGKDLPGER